MKKLLLLLSFIIVFSSVWCQYTLRIVLNNVATKKEDAVYVAGTFNNWNARDEAYKLKPFGTSRRVLVLKDLPAVKYEFKFTRGAMNKWEATAKGEFVPNHEVALNNDTTIEFSIAGWEDDFPEKPKPNTATAQVHVIDTAFAMPQLNRKRRIWAYLPKDYQASGKKYPVIYMHDGQNLFNEQTAGFGEWGIDEALDTLMKKYNKEVIVIGIDHGGDKRMTEYNPFDNAKFGKGEGEAYVEFLVKTLKPFIDKNYRTLKDSAHTFIAGSSMGGLISLYAVAKYPNTFGGAGIFSPAFWVAPQLFDEIAKASFGTHRKLFFYAGGKESETMVSDMDRMIDVIKKKHNYDITRLVDPIAKHNEAAWRKKFPYFFEFITE